MNNMQKIYPITRMQDVIDMDTKENLFQKFAFFNHVNIGYVSSARDARNSVPPIYRKKGFYITYYIEDNTITEYFIGNKIEAGTDEWFNDNLWRSMEIDNIANNIPIADEEDITIENNIIKLKDKPYSPIDFNGKGVKYVPKNLVKNTSDEIDFYVNYLSQDMINNENTIYIIKYDFNLLNKTIEMPRGAIILLYGGTISDGAIKGNDSEIKGIGTINCTLLGNWKEQGVSVARPKTNIVGYCYFDTTINKPIWWNGFNWVDATGNKV